MTDATKFWDKAAAKYALSPISDPAAYEYTTGRTRSYLKPTDQVLELGCGTGSTALLLAPDAGQITGMDISPAMIQIAQDKAQGVENVSFKVATATQALQQGERADEVLGCNIFHLTDDLEGVMAAVADHLAPGALFISKTPCLAEPSIGLKRFAFRAMIPVMRMAGYAPFVHMLRFAQLEAMIENAGFELVETGSFPQMSRFIVARRRG